MPTPIERKEYQRPVWEEFSWEINGQTVSGVKSELEGGSKDLKKIRVAIGVPQDAQNVTIDIRQRERVERDDTGRQSREVSEEYYVVSYWSPGQRIGSLVSFPREVVERRDGEGGPLFIQIEQVSVYSNDSSNRPTYVNLV